MSRLRWTPLDVGLLVGSSLSIVAFFAVRWAFVAPRLAHAIRPFEYSDAPLPFMTRLTLSGIPTWIACLAAIVALGAGAVLRTKSTMAARAAMSVAIVAVLLSIGSDAVGITVTRAADPTDFGAPGITRCPCPVDYA